MGSNEFVYSSGRFRLVKNVNNRKIKFQGPLKTPIYKKKKKNAQPDFVNFFPESRPVLWFFIQNKKPWMGLAVIWYKYTSSNQIWCLRTYYIFSSPLPDLFSCVYPWKYIPGKIIAFWKTPVSDDERTLHCRMHFKTLKKFFEQMETDTVRYLFYRFSWAVYSEKKLET